MARQLAEMQQPSSPRQRETALELTAVDKTYGSGNDTVVALRGLSMRIARRSFTAVMGPSGSGKSTFLHCASGLDQPSAGSVRLGETELVGMGEPRLTRLRRRRIGFVFQSYNLIASLTVQQNILLPLRLAGDRPNRGVLRDVAQMLGIDDRLHHHPAQLSGGQQQRVAIARALVTRPEIVFADEPTGSLDAETAGTVLHLLRDAVDRWGQTVVMVTHDPLAASRADSVLFLADGRLADAVTGASSDEIAARTSRFRAGVRR